MLCTCVDVLMRVHAGVARVLAACMYVHVCACAVCLCAACMCVCTRNAYVARNVRVAARLTRARGRCFLTAARSSRKLVAGNRAAHRAPRPPAPSRPPRHPLCSAAWALSAAPLTATRPRAAWHRNLSKRPARPDLPRGGRAAEPPEWPPLTPPSRSWGLGHRRAAQPPARGSSLPTVLWAPRTARSGAGLLQGGGAAPPRGRRGRPGQGQALQREGSTSSLGHGDRGDRAPNLEQAGLAGHSLRPRGAGLLQGPRGCRGLACSAGVWPGATAVKGEPIPRGVAWQGWRPGAGGSAGPQGGPSPEP